MFKELTNEQIDKFYSEYVTLKAKRYAGKILSKQAWKDNMEEELNRTKPNEYWTNEDIRRASRGSAKYGSWTQKQKDALMKNFWKDEDRVRAFEKEFNQSMRYVDENGDEQYYTDRFQHWLSKNEGFFFAFLYDYEGEDWNEIFDS